VADIVQQLRHPEGLIEWSHSVLMDNAADEIERLRRLRNASDVLAKAVATYCGDDAWADRALKAWQEARCD
jgi:hypothetical protein